MHLSFSFCRSFRILKRNETIPSHCDPSSPFLYYRYCDDFLFPFSPLVFLNWVPFPLSRYFFFFFFFFYDSTATAGYFQVERFRYCDIFFFFNYSIPSLVTVVILLLLFFFFSTTDVTSYSCTVLDTFQIEFLQTHVQLQLFISLLQFLLPRYGSPNQRIEGSFLIRFFLFFFYTNLSQLLFMLFVTIIYLIAISYYRDISCSLMDFRTEMIEGSSSLVIRCFFFFFFIPIPITCVFAFFLNSHLINALFITVSYE